MSDEGDEYQVGYGKPPKEHRFKKGQSGNPKGRRRKPQEPKKPSDAALIMKELGSEMISIHGRDYQKIEALLHALYAQAIKGNTTAMRLYFQTMDKLGLLKPIGTGEQRSGVLVVPSMASLDAWKARAAANQAKFRGSDPEGLARLHEDSGAMLSRRPSDQSDG